MNFSEKLQTLRKARGMSQESLADALGVSRQAVSKWELGSSLPETDKLTALSDLFHVTIDYLVKDSVTEPNTAHAPGQTPESDDIHYMRRPYFFRPDYEYKSKKKLFGLPLVHINVGYGMKKAKGFIAIGNLAVGVISVGLVSLGVISIGVLAAGLIGLGALVIGVLLAGGAFAAGAFAAGGIAFGIIAVGGVAIGVCSFGGCAIASHFAAGGYARAHVAVGDAVSGVKTLHILNHDLSSVSRAQVQSLLQEELPRLWSPLTRFILSLFSAS